MESTTEQRARRIAGTLALAALVVAVAVIAGHALDSPASIDTYVASALRERSAPCRSSRSSCRASRGTRLASRLLAFARGQHPMLRPMEVAPALRRPREAIGKVLGPSIELLVEYSPDRSWAKTGADQLALALFDLAVNARDAMPTGGQSRIDGSVRHLHLPASAAERRYVSIRVIDDGAGMTPEVLARAIEPFFTTRMPGLGGGFGLAQVHGFVHRCEGELVIRSAAGEGTTVEMLPPSVDAPIDVIDGLGKTPRPGRRVDPRTRPVVADDDPVRGALVELLGDAGCDVSEAADGLSALASLERIDPRVTVIDVTIAGMNGTEVARRTQARLPRLPTVFVAGDRDTPALDDIAGAVVLRKPFGDEQRPSAVVSALETKVA